MRLILNSNYNTNNNSYNSNSSNSSNNSYEENELFFPVSYKKYHCYIPEEEVQDIDNFSDWEIAEMKYNLLKKN